MKVVFLDRDGVINEFPGDGLYVTKVKDFHFIDGSIEAIKKLNDAGYLIFVISNQAGVGKGIYSKTKLEKITQKMFKGVESYGAKIRGAFYCTHRSDAGCECRKPAIGSIIKSLKLVKKELDHVDEAYFVGDTKSDMLTGYKAGCKTILVLSGRAKKKQIKNWGVKPDFVSRDLMDAVTKIIIGKPPKKTIVKK